DVAARSDNREWLSGGAFRESRHQVRDGGVANADRKLRIRRNQRWDVLRCQVGNQVAKIIRAQDDSFHRVSGSLWLGNSKANKIGDLLSKARCLPGFRKPRSHRRKNVAAVECVAHRLAKVMFRRDVPYIE